LTQLRICNAVKEGCVRTHGWSGELPVDEDQARGRILAVTRALITEGGAPGIAEVARAVGVSRPTVYRYFGTTEALLDAASLDAITDLVEQLSEHVEHFVRSPQVDHADVLVDVVVWVLGRLREDPVLARLVTPGRLDATLRNLTAASSISLGQELLNRMPIDWTALGLPVELRAELVEHLLRMLQSLVLDPADRSPAQQRAYLDRWLAPALRQL
jgi:AcrR family transcriptional regulator